MHNPILKKLENTTIQVTKEDLNQNDPIAYAISREAEKRGIEIENIIVGIDWVSIQVNGYSDDFFHNLERSTVENIHWYKHENNPVSVQYNAYTEPDNYTTPQPFSFQILNQFYS